MTKGVYEAAIPELKKCGGRGQPKRESRLISSLFVAEQGREI